MPKKKAVRRKSSKKPMTKTQKILKKIGHSIKGEQFKGGEPQRVAVLLSKARKAGARIPKSRIKKRTTRR